MAKQKIKVNRKRLVLFYILVFLAIYFIVSIVRLFEKPVDTVLIKKGELINYEEVVGYIIRDEELLDLSTYEGIVKSEVQDATRVSKGAAILKYVSKSEEQIMEKINKLNEKIEVAKESQQTIFSNDVKLIESEIENNIYSQIKDNLSLDSIKENKKYLNEKIYKKAKIVGELSPAGSELKNLINERAEYEKQLNDAEKSLIAPEAGLVSYRIDGFENILTYDSISLLTSEKLAELKLSLDQTIPIDTKNIKLIDNFKCYIAVPMHSEEASNVMLNDTVYLRFSNSDDTLIPAQVEYISNEEDGTLIVFKINSNVEELTKYRKISLDVVWWRSTGLKVNKEVLFDTELQVVVSGEEASGDEVATASEVINSGDISGDIGDIIEKPADVPTNPVKTKTIKIPTIKIRKAYSEEDVFVKVLKETDEFVIIDNYKDAELLEMGVDESLITNRKTLKMFDEAVMVEKPEEILQ